MLLGDLYTIIGKEREGESFHITLSMNAGHRIFDGHFPGRPVVPGVCLIQMVLEATESVLNICPLRLISATQIKFIATIDPRMNGSLDMRLVLVSTEENSIHLTAVISAGGTVCFKFNGMIGTTA
ncbi:MAG: hydroxymyristoyl-ACP dehydratase [Bacteroidota bacterium]|nr:hydroxymyristoyl-ACP dehydratase [Bacteroidota bacterium]MDP4217665.1 hydroxymyristoyl-ACP dehydratase [Bacteroidota bacterium]MDP4245132.1 hydroxymyristoyl-ACP dehydratase [Bacteroidota bacterium]MDP4253350.1 hydroxymyristoyl-ACP dehydratase [Bacteroidota bacterium]MDP4256793.1 hydroxymyristoyl-ACP dehydratase [Bacteroidota bacterium]